MPSPFPGMDPYLEQHWRDVHARLIVYSGDQLQERLPRDLLARVEEGVAIDYDGEERNRLVRPDARVVEDPQPPGSEYGGVATVASAAAVAEPLIVDADTPHRHVEIVDASSGSRVVTVIEFLSPTNKLPTFGRRDYHRKQIDHLSAGLNLVEIDLIREGEFSLAVSAGELPREYRDPYLVCVRRATRRRQAALYRAPLRQKLPAIPVPLRPGDPDAVLELQPLIDQCYARGRYDRIDYSAEPDPPLPPEDAAWADERLRAAGRRR